jgi:hypothetical protein
MVLGRIGGHPSDGPEIAAPRAAQIRGSPFAVSERSVADLRARAAAYRRVAETACVLSTREALVKIADRYDALADEGEQEQLWGGPVRDE